MASINDELDRLPEVREYAHDVKGRVLFSPRTGLTFVPYRDQGGGWSCVIVIGNGVYPVGGHDIDVSNREILRCPEMRIVRSILAR